MADLPVNVTTIPTVTDDVFLADRQRFWSFFTSLVTGGAVFLVVLLILMAFFLA